MIARVGDNMKLKNSSLDYIYSIDYAKLLPYNKIFIGGSDGRNMMSYIYDIGTNSARYLSGGFAGITMDDILIIESYTITENGRYPILKYYDLEGNLLKTEVLNY